MFIHLPIVQEQEIYLAFQRFILHIQHKNFDFIAVLSKEVKTNLSEYQYGDASFHPAMWLIILIYFHTGR